MKKILFALSIVFVGATTSLNAQPPEGRKFDPTAMKEKQKAKLKEDLKLTDEQAESVVKIQMESMQQMRGLRDLPQEERMSKMKDINEMAKTRLKKELNDDRLVEKVLQYQQEQRKQRMKEAGIRGSAERVKGGE